MWSTPKTQIPKHKPRNPKPLDLTKHLTIVPCTQTLNPKPLDPTLYFSASSIKSFLFASRLAITSSIVKSPSNAGKGSLCSGQGFGLGSSPRQTRGRGPCWGVQGLEMWDYLQRKNHFRVRNGEICGISKILRSNKRGQGGRVGYWVRGSRAWGFGTSVACPEQACPNTPSTTDPPRSTDVTFQSQGSRFFPFRVKGGDFPLLLCGSRIEYGLHATSGE